MATIRQIVSKAVEVKTASDALTAAIAERDPLVTQLQAAQNKVTAAQANLDALLLELKTLINEP